MPAPGQAAAQRPMLSPSAPLSARVAAPWGASVSELS